MCNPILSYGENVTQNVVLGIDSAFTYASFFFVFGLSMRNDLKPRCQENFHKTQPRDMPIGGRCFWWWNYCIQEKKIFFNFLKSIFETQK
jgi:hypothetical protein